MRRRPSSSEPLRRPDNGFDELDLETLFDSGPDLNLPPGWTLTDAEALWRYGDLTFCQSKPCPGWWAWEAWGAPGGGS